MAKLLMSSDDMQRSLRRISYEILERFPDTQNLVFVGIKTRGYPLAIQLANYIDPSLEVIPLDIHTYRDDVQSDTIKEMDTRLNGKKVVMVDDVLFTGRSIRAALEATLALGRPDVISLAILIDRGHRELPIRADFVGKNIPSSKNERVQVRLLSIDGVDEVTIE